MTRDTSIEAYNTIKDNGLLSKRRWQVYDVLYNFGPLTAGEVWRFYLKDNAQIDSIRPRMAELNKIGVATNIGERICKYNGTLCMIWDVTSKLPIKFDKPIRHKCPHCNGKGYTEELQSRLF